MCRLPFPVFYACLLVVLVALAPQTTATAQCEYEWLPWPQPAQLPNGPVHAMAVVGDSLYVAGDFTAVGDLPARHIARWNGSIWSALGAGIDGNLSNGLFRGDQVRMMDFDGDLVATGNFTTAGDLTVEGIARWDGTAWAMPVMTLPTPRGRPGNPQRGHGGSAPRPLPWRWLRWLRLLLPDERIAVAGKEQSVVISEKTPAPVQSASLAR